MAIGLGQPGYSGYFAVQGNQQSDRDRTTGVAQPTPAPAYIVRYTPDPHGEKLCVNAAPVISEHGNQAEAEDYAVGLVRGGYAVWGSIDIFANTNSHVVVEIRTGPQSTGRGY